MGRGLIALLALLLMSLSGGGANRLRLGTAGSVESAMAGAGAGFLLRLA